MKNKLMLIVLFMLALYVTTQVTGNGGAFINEAFATGSN